MITKLLLWFLISVSLAFSNPLAKKYQIERLIENPAVKNFQEYLRIDTSTKENIIVAVEFWKRLASDVGLPFVVYEPAGEPICVITWEGTNTSLPSIMLNSHMDVVTVDETDWSYSPFSAYIDENGDIYARGSQDTKDVGIQYLEAIRRLRQENVSLQRTLHITLMPDEETGGFNGMKAFMDTEEFKSLNVGFVLDEGLVSSDDTFYAAYQDKRPWQMNFTVYGKGGHGSSIPDDSAFEQTRKLIDTVMKFREEQKALMKSKYSTDFGAYHSLNINIITGGLLPNVIPRHISLVIDMRLSSSSTITEMEALVNSWLSVTGNRSTVEFIRRDDYSAATRLDDTNPYWIAIQKAANDIGIKIVPVVCPATSDMLVLRNRGIPAIGFSTKTNTVSRIHGVNEYLNVETFLRGIDVYVAILKKLGNVL